MPLTTDPRSFNELFEAAGVKTVREQAIVKGELKTLICLEYGRRRMSRPMCTEHVPAQVLAALQVAI